MNSPHHILIVGGGTAGWMSANILAYSLHDQPVKISVIESSVIPRIGVGEGSTPALKVFFDRLGIAETEWMPLCSATYKCGITFSNWSAKPGFSSYFHPFASSIDRFNLPSFIGDVNARLRGDNRECHPNQYFLSARLAAEQLAPIPNYNFPFEISYGYHFDAELLGAFLRDHALKRGVEHHVGTIARVEQDTGGDVNAVHTDDGRVFTADLFVDCTGFSSLLSTQTLQTPYVSYASHLFNDAAVAMPTDISDKIPSETVSIAMKHGWAWQIPLRHRFGNGYVYSSSHCSADEAETELRTKLGLLESDTSARHLKMKVGRLEQSWNRNVLAAGLSQGFIEPLEATALLLIQQTVSLFSHFYLEAGFTDRHRTAFNQRINEQFDRTRDYIITHYQTNSREDTDYWRDARGKREQLSDSLQAIYSCWLGGGNLEEEIRRQGIENFYPVSSWYCLLAGVGILPDAVSGVGKQRAVVVDFNARCALNFRDHRLVLAEQS